MYKFQQIGIFEKIKKLGDFGDKYYDKCMDEINGMMIVQINNFKMIMIDIINIFFNLLNIKTNFIKPVQFLIPYLKYPVLTNTPLIHLYQSYTSNQFQFKYISLIIQINHIFASIFLSLKQLHHKYGQFILFHQLKNARIYNLKQNLIIFFNTMGLDTRETKNLINQIRPFLRFYLKQLKNQEFCLLKRKQVKLLTKKLSQSTNIYTIRQTLKYSPLKQKLIKSIQDGQFLKKILNNSLKISSKIILLKYYNTMINGFMSPQRLKKWKDYPQYDRSIEQYDARVCKMYMGKQNGQNAII